MSQTLVGHHREQCSPIVPDAFPNSTSQLVVGPGASAGFRIGSDIRGHDATWKIFEPHHLSDAFGAGYDRAAMLVPVMQRMTSCASGISSLHQPDAQDVIRCMTGTSMAARS